MGQSESNTNLKVQWEWQSNPDPWSSEPQQWTPYKPLDNYLLEKAYQNQENQVELEDFIVFLTSEGILQQRKNDANRQRRVRRNEQSAKSDEESKVNQDDMTRKQRFFGVETLKADHKTLGSLEQFMMFFENRGPEIKRFAILYKVIEDSQDIERLNKEIMPLLIASIQEEAGRSGKNKGEEEITHLFQKMFSSFKEFYGDVLRAYTMNGFLYQNLNRYLTTEDWGELYSLLPYAFCLCNAFLQSELSNNNSNKKSPSPNVAEKNDQDSTIILYRGGEFDEAALSFYDSPTLSTFSWNGVTSTSTNRTLVENLMYTSVDVKKIPVMFVIEIPTSLDEIKTLKWIDMKPFSVFPDEDEIILGPGSTFKLMSFHRDHKGAEIKLKLVSNVGSLALQNEVKMDKVAKIMYLEGKELVESFRYLKGDRFVEELELTGIHLDGDTLEKLSATLSTLVSLKRLACMIMTSKEKNHLPVILEAVRKHKISTLEIFDVSLDDELIKRLSAEEIRNMGSLRTLKLNFEKQKITDVGIASLFSAGLRHLTSLTTLSLDFTFCDKISDEGIASLGSGIRNLSSLANLNLNFCKCLQLTDKWKSRLSSRIITNQTSVKNFTIWRPAEDRYEAVSGVLLSMNPEDNIEHSVGTVLEVKREVEGESINDDTTNNMLQEIRDTPTRFIDSNDKLDLDCYRRNKITNEWIVFLSSGIKPRTSLTSLDLDFENYDDITDKDIATISPVIRHLTSLTSLRIGFNHSCHITVEGTASFCSEIRYLTSLTVLDLCFHNFPQITDEVLAALGRGIRHLTSLKSFTLRLLRCPNLTSQGLNNFKGLLNDLNFK